MKNKADLQDMPSSLDQIVDWLIPIAKKRSAQSVIAKLVFASSTYFIWQERNGRLFKKKKKSCEQLIEVILSIIRLKLLTFHFKKTSRVDRVLAVWKLPCSLIKNR